MMLGVDPLLLCSVGFLITVLTLVIARIMKLHFDEKAARRRTEAILAMATEDNRQEARNDREPLVVGGRRIGNVRRRAHPNTNNDEMDFVRNMANQNLDSDEDGESPLMQADVDENIGKKKLAKLQAKEERRKEREAELAEREERKKREKKLEERLIKEREQEALQEAAEAEIKRIEKEEREKAEELEYQKLKEAFEVDEEGFDELNEDESMNLLRDFEEYIRNTKVVNMDELAAHFSLRTEDAIDRLNHLVNNGTLTGVMDDRGKFISITHDELDAVAKFINQRGRVSMGELVDYSNKLIGLQAKHIASVQ